jgi:enamine deaminase RidA (YjgF/YER057c/UK114 family)
MASVSARLAELGLKLPAVPAPLAAYKPAVRSGTYVYTSGQLPFVDGELAGTGKVGAEVTTEEAVGYARISAINALAAVHQLVGIESVVRVVKMLGYVASSPDFYGQSAVVNGASNLLSEIFGDTGRHARSAVGVAVLPLDAPVEIELIVEVAPA